MYRKIFEEFCNSLSLPDMREPNKVVYSNGFVKAQNIMAEVYKFLVAYHGEQWAASHSRYQSLIMMRNDLILNKAVKLVTKETFPELMGMLEDLTEKASCKMPLVFIQLGGVDEVPIARDYNNGLEVLVLPQAFLSMCTDYEVRGALAHELGHFKLKHLHARRELLQKERPFVPHYASFAGVVCALLAFVGAMSAGVLPLHRFIISFVVYQIVFYASPHLYAVFFAPKQNYVSLCREQEKEADDFAAKVLGEEILDYLVFMKEYYHKVSHTDYEDFLKAMDKDRDFADVFRDRLKRETETQQPLGRTALRNALEGPGALHPPINDRIDFLEKEHNL